MSLFYVLPSEDNEIEYIGHVADHFINRFTNFDQALEFAGQMSKDRGQQFEVVRLSLVAFAHAPVTGNSEFRGEARRE